MDSFLFPIAASAQAYSATNAPEERSTDLKMVDETRSKKALSYFLISRIAVTTVTASSGFANVTESVLFSYKARAISADAAASEPKSNRASSRMHATTDRKLILEANSVILVPATILNWFAGEY